MVVKPVKNILSWMHFKQVTVTHSSCDRMPMPQDHDDVRCWDAYPSRCEIKKCLWLKVIMMWVQKPVYWHHHDAECREACILASTRCGMCRSLCLDIIMMRDAEKPESRHHHDMECKRSLYLGIIMMWDAEKSMSRHHYDAEMSVPLHHHDIVCINVCALASSWCKM